jgi:hypothetical protein
MMITCGVVVQSLALTQSEEERSFIGSGSPRRCRSAVLHTAGAIRRKRVSAVHAAVYLDRDRSSFPSVHQTATETGKSLMLHYSSEVHLTHKMGRRRRDGLIPTPVDGTKEMRMNPRKQAPWLSVLPMFRG